MRLLSPVVALLVLAASHADAASLFVRPTTVVYSPGSAAATVTVTNRGETPVTAQLRVFAWDQADNEDQLKPTTAIAASPPMMVIPAGASQTIRLVRSAKTAAQREESYRLLVDEIVDRGAETTASNVVIQLRYSVPVFVMARAKDAAKLEVNAQVAADSLVFGAVNRGRSHAQISNIAVTYADGSSKLVGGGLLGYVLPEKDRRWTLPLDDGQGKPLRVKAIVNGQEMSLKL